MKLKLNAITNEPQTKNNNSRDMPPFLLSKHTRFFDFSSHQHPETFKKINPSRNTSTIDFTGAPEKRLYPKSIRNSSIVGSLMQDDFPTATELKHKQIYINKIFGQKREIEVPALYVQSHKSNNVPMAYQSQLHDGSGFSKPFQFSRLVDQLNSTKSINRDNPGVFDMRDSSNRFKTSNERVESRQQTRRSHATTNKKKYDSIAQPISVDKELRRMSCQNTREKHKIVYDFYKNEDERQGKDTVMFSNAMGHLVDSDNIMQMLERNRHRRRSQRK